jgi:beta-barrel assembly-enhancing protease
MSWLYSTSTPYAVSATAHCRADGTKHRGRLLIDDDELIFEANDARVALPLSGLKATRNRLLGGPIQISHRAEPDWVFRTRHTTLFNDPAFDQSEALFATKKRLHLNWYRLRRTLRLLLLLFLVCLIAFPAFRKKTTGVALAYVPASYEIKMGLRVFEDIALKRKLVNDPELEGELQKIAARVTEALPASQREYPLSFYIINDPSVNAFAIPGGIIVVHSGLIREAQSSEELAGVLAHEVGHVVHRHSFTKLAEMLGTWVILATVTGETEYVPDIATVIIAQSYSRDAESEADETALRLLEDARVDPQGLIGFFERQAREYKRHVSGDMDMVMRMVSTHPHPADRARAMKERAATFPANYEPEPIKVDLERMKAKVAQLPVPIEKKITPDSR